jgi:membrane protein implicated in regulation of membrane protease activity
MEILGSIKLFWFALGLVFMVLEVMTPGIVFLFFGVGAWVVLGLVLILPVPPLLQWIIFVLVSVIALATLRKQITRLFSRRGWGRVDSLQEPMVAGVYLGREVEVLSDIAPGRPGLVELNGTNWRATAAVAIAQGTRARVVEVKDLILEVEPL